VITISTVPLRKRLGLTTVVLGFTMISGSSIGAIADRSEPTLGETVAPILSPITEASVVSEVVVSSDTDTDTELEAAMPIVDRPIAKAVRVTPPTVVDPFRPITSPDVGDHCATSLDAADISEFFSNPIGSFQGADYQRAFRLGDDRVLWTFQDAFISGTLVHNVGMIQSGRCFTILNSGARSWLLGELTSNMSQWQWIFDGGMSADGSEFHLFVVQMNETGGSYLSKSRPTLLRRVILDVSTLEVVKVVEEAQTGTDLYGWGVTNDQDYTYLYSHCYQQFGYDTPWGFGECSMDVKLARVPLGEFDAEREYWDGTGWTTNYTFASPVVDGTFVFSGNNPAQIRFDGSRFVLVEKQGDWWGETVDFGVSDNPQGPFVHIASIKEPLKCDRSACNTYFASWIPWADSNGDLIWSIGHNRWNGAEARSYLSIYRPTFSTINI